MKYEYKTIKLQPGDFEIDDASRTDLSELDRLFNRSGEEGWELVSTEGIIEGSFGRSPETAAIILFFKRPLAE